MAESIWGSKVQPRRLGDLALACIAFEETIARIASKDK